MSREPAGAGRTSAAAGRMRARRPWATCVLTAMTLALVAGCTSHAAGPPGGSSPQAQAETISWFFPASIQQSDAVWGFYDSLRSLELHSVNTCTSKLGLSGADAAYLTGYQDYLENRFPAVPGYRQQWSANLLNVGAVARTGMLVEVMTGPPARPSGAGLPGSEELALQQDEARCVTAARGPVARFQHAGEALKRIWVGILQREFRSPAVTRANTSFASCMQQKGAPKADADSPEDFQNWLGNVVNPQAASAGHSATAPRVAVDRFWTAAWAQCSPRVYAAWQASLLKAQKTFLAVHYQEVTALEQLVSKSVLQMQ